MYRNLMPLLEFLDYNNRLKTLGFDLTYFNSGNNRYINLNHGVLFNPVKTDQVDLSEMMPEFKVFINGNWNATLQSVNKRLVLKKCINHAPYSGIHIVAEVEKEGIVGFSGFLGILKFAPKSGEGEGKQVSFWWNTKAQK
jgi:hypothetical protein